MITPDLLTRISLFAQIPESERTTIASRSADIRLLKDESLLLEGQAAAFYGLLEGRIDVYKSIGGRDHRITTYEPGEYFGEVPLLLGAPSLATLKAAEPSRVMRLEPQDFLQLVNHCTVLSGEISKTMMERVGRIRQWTVETPPATATVIGHRLDVDCYHLREFLSRNRIPFIWREPDEDAPMTPPVVEFSDGLRLEAPSFRRLADALGLQTEPKLDSYDVVIVGGGPAGLAAAVYGASEGLRTLLLERLACGGQAGTSSRIENYLGFPGGLTGDELSARAYRQADRFGAELLVARCATRLERGDPISAIESHAVVLEDGSRIPTRSVILATGVDWRRLDVPGIERLVGHGVYYGAARAEAMGFREKVVHLVGGGNSAGQAALLFSVYAKSVTMLVRGPSLAESMSQYLIDQLTTRKNVTIETEVEVAGVEGSDRLEAIEVACGPSRRLERRPSDGLFVFIGAGAETDWLPSEVTRDQWGYVCTGRDVLDLLSDRSQQGWPLERDPFLLETSIPGVLAAGDVRHGSIKRVSAGVGEGSMAIAVVHQYLAELRGRHTTALGAIR
ncbi:MAG: FAD-dependent oxidoreductase [Gemmatimonadales bacterium]